MNGGQIQMKFLETRNGLIEQINKIKMADFEISEAKKIKNDEFYTQLIDIEKEVLLYLQSDQNLFKDKIILLPSDDPKFSNFVNFFKIYFERLQLKKIIATSYSAKGKGSLCVILGIDNISYYDLSGNGDFRSEELSKLLNECDMVITNPPFSLFREFIDWVVGSNKKFLLLGNLNAIAYKKIFNLIKENKLWLGQSISSGGREFEIPKDKIDMNKFNGSIRDGKFFQQIIVRWFTNLDYKKRHIPLSLMTKDHIENSVLKRPFENYDDHNAIEISKTKNIPSDYDGVMGVPISFLDKYCFEQFDILECHEPCINIDLLKQRSDFKEFKSRQIVYDGKLCQKVYHRIFIRHKNLLALEEIESGGAAEISP